MSTLRRARDERGAVAIEFLLVITVLIAVFLLLLQYAVKAHSQQIATAAATEGLAAAASYAGTTTAGRSAARDYLTKLTPGLHNATVTVTRTATTATVTVTGDVDQLVPFLPVHVSIQVQGPVERFAPTGTAPTNIATDAAVTP